MRMYEDAQDGKSTKRPPKQCKSPALAFGRSATLRVSESVSSARHISGSHCQSEKRPDGIYRQFGAKSSGKTRFRVNSFARILPLRSFSRTGPTPENHLK